MKSLVAAKPSFCHQWQASIGENKNSLIRKLHDLEDIIKRLEAFEKYPFLLKEKVQAFWGDFVLKQIFSEEESWVREELYTKLTIYAR